MQHSTSVAIGILVFGLFLFVILTSSKGYAQPAPPNTQLKSGLTSLPSMAPKIHAVKITSPAKGQQVPLGSNLAISGTSVDTPNSKCQVSVIVNRVKPYQPTSGAGPGGPADYSKWNFLLTEKYTTIKSGPNNRITAKYTCTNNAAVISFASLNVTGVTTTVKRQVAQQNQSTNTKGQKTSLTTGNNAVTVSNRSIPAPTVPASPGPNARTNLGNSNPTASNDRYHTHKMSPYSDSTGSKFNSNSNHHHATSKSKGHRSNDKSKVRSSSKFRFDPFAFPIYG